jgi:type VI secretion system protein ImpE
MNAGELFKAGKLQEAIDAQVQEVKANPGDQNKRNFLFELFAFAGDLERARRQLEALTYSEVELEGARQQYRDLLDAEAKRREVFQGRARPQFFLEPPEHAKRRLEALPFVHNHQLAEARALLAEANQMAPSLAGELNGSAFQGLSDYDDRFATVLEVMFKGVYGWVPLEQIASLVAAAPRLPRDLLWFPARLVLRDGTTGEVFLPVLYPFSHAEPSDLIRLGREVDWKNADEGPIVGVGPHQYLVGDRPVALLEWRELHIAA